MLELICASLHTSAARYGAVLHHGTRADRGRSVNSCVYTGQPRHVSQVALRTAWLKSFVSWHCVEDETKPRWSCKGER